MLVKQGCKPEIGDVLVAKDGSILKYAFEVKENQDVVILSSIAILKPDQDMVNVNHKYRTDKGNSLYKTIYVTNRSKGAACAS